MLALLDYHTSGYTLVIHTDYYMRLMDYCSSGVHGGAIQFFVDLTLDYNRLWPWSRQHCFCKTVWGGRLKLCCRGIIELI